MAQSLVLQAHRVRFLDYTPQSISCLAFSDDEDLAVARSDGSIEIWRSEDQWYQKGIIPGRLNASVEVLLWCRGNLYSSGLDGKIVQWDTDLFRQQYVTEGNGGAIWCASPDSTGQTLAAGFEDGFIRLYAVCGTGELNFIKAVGPQGTRILSLSWQPSNRFIFAGGTESIVKRYDMNKGICDMRITLDKPKDKDTLVWSIADIDDGHFVSGDSGGKIQIWDSYHGTLVQSFQLHLADILSVVVSADKKTIFAGGIDQKVVCLKRVSHKASQVGWVQSGEVIAHTHDIRALALSRKNCLVSGGVDTTLVVYDQYNFKKVSCEVIYPFPLASSVCHLATESEQLLHQRNTSVDLWQLSSVAMPTPATSSTHVGSRESQPFVHAHPVCLARLALPSSCADHLTCSAISDDGSLICLSNSSKLWLYQLMTTEGKVNLILSSDIKARHLKFLQSDQIIIATIDGSVIIGNIINGEEGADLVMSTLLECSDRLVTAIHVCTRQLWIVVVFAHREIVLFEQSKGTSYRLPSVLSPIASLCFHPRQSIALVLCLNRQLLCVNLETQRFTELIPSYRDRENGLSLHWGPVVGSCVVTLGNKESLVLACQECCAYVNLKALEPSVDPKGKMRKAGSKRPASNSEKTWSELYHHGNLVTKPQAVKLMFLSQLNEKKLVFVEKNWSQITATFPQPIFRKRYKN